MDYKKILEGIVDIINTTEKSDIGFANICTYIGENCPELKESEDERIRKELISFFTERAKYTEDSTFNGLSSKGIIAWLEKQSNINEPINRDKFAQGILRGAAINLITWIDYNAAEGNMCLSNMECKDIEDSLVSGNWDKIYAYIKKKLEKQGEQKADDKIKPKFQNGQWIVWQNKYYKVNDNGCGYELIDQNGLSTSLEYGTIDENAHLWDVIEDARDGDVLCYETKNELIIFIYKNGHIHYHCCYCNGHLTTVDSFFVVDKYLLCYIHPATKEQRNQLEKAMTDAGYTFDFDKKELKKIEQKPAWSEEDEMHIRELESLVKQVWATAEHENDKNTIHKMSDLSFFLKTLKPQLKQEWSEEDEQIALSIEQVMNCASLLNIVPEKIDKIRTWLKSLKERYIWEPSEEQMKALHNLNLTGNLSYAGQRQELIDLYNDLKELKV